MIRKRNTRQLGQLALTSLLFCLGCSLPGATPLPVEVTPDMAVLMAGGFDITSFPADAAPLALAVADLNGDHNPDVVASYNTLPAFSLLLGDGRGGLSSASTTAISESPLMIAPGDFDGDRRLDLAFPGFGYRKLEIMPGTGVGGFGVEKDVPYPDKNLATVIATGDWNGDGKLDVACAFVGSVGVLLNDGTGNFPTANSFATADYITQLAVADFNGDGAVDLAVATSDASNTSSSLEIWLNDGTAHFQQSATAPLGEIPGSIAVGDWNGDGRADLAVANDGGTVSVFLGDGMGGLKASPVINIASPFSLVTADFDGDGKLDLAVLSDGTLNSSPSASVSILTGDGTGTFTGTAQIPAGQGHPGALAVGDLNHDQRPDLVVGTSNASEIRVLINQAH